MANGFDKPTRQGWSAGEIIAAAVFSAGVLFVLLCILVQTGELINSNIIWLWDIAGGEGGTATERSTARAAWAGVAVGIVTTILLAFTLAYTQISTRTALLSARVALRAADTTERLGHRQIRAYIGAHSFSISIIAPGDYATSPTIKISLTNSGQTPALRLRYRMGWMNTEPMDIERLAENEYHSVQDLGAGQTIEQEIPCQSWVGNELIATFYDEKSSWSQGTVIYEDVFGGVHKTFFRYRIYGRVFRGSLALSWDLTQTGNGSD